MNIGGASDGTGKWVVLGREPFDESNLSSQPPIKTLPADTAVTKPSALTVAIPGIELT
jgi:hypothetical protein